MGAVGGRPSSTAGLHDPYFSGTPALRMPSTNLVIGAAMYGTYFSIYAIEMFGCISLNRCSEARASSIRHAHIERVGIDGEGEAGLIESQTAAAIAREAM
jgi:hypothetical protein